MIVYIEAPHQWKLQNWESYCSQHVHARILEAALV